MVLAPLVLPPLAHSDVCQWAHLGRLLLRCGRGAAGGDCAAGRRRPGRAGGPCRARDVPGAPSKGAGGSRASHLRGGPDRGVHAAVTAAAPGAWIPWRWGGGRVPRLPAAGGVPGMGGGRSIRRATTRLPWNVGQVSAILAMADDERQLLRASGARGAPERRWEWGRRCAVVSGECPYHGVAAGAVASAVVRAVRETSPRRPAVGPTRQPTMRDYCSWMMHLQFSHGLPGTNRVCWSSVHSVDP